MPPSAGQGVDVGYDNTIRREANLLGPRSWMSHEHTARDKVPMYVVQQ